MRPCDEPYHTLCHGDNIFCFIVPKYKAGENEKQIVHMHSKLCKTIMVKRYTYHPMKIKTIYFSPWVEMKFSFL